jgi:hypothetical protein
MDLTLWFPALFLLGLLTMGSLFAFLVGCDKV